MKTFLILTVIIYLGFVNPYNLDYVSGVVGFVELVDFDGDGNIYATSFVKNNDGGRDHTLYKLSPERELLSTINLPSRIEIVYKMHVTTKGDVYFFFSGDNRNNTFAILKSGSKEVELVESISHELFYLDPYDNLYYGRENGVHILRPNSTTPILIKNLENFYVFRPGTATVDKDGNVYFGADGEHSSNNSVVLLTKEELQNEVPEAKFFDVQDDSDEQIFDIVVDERNDIWIITAMVSYRGFVKKLAKNGTYETIKLDPTHPDLDVTAAKDRIWVVAANTFETNSPSIYYVTLDNEVVDIPELQNLTQQMYFLSESLADKDGIAYFKTFNVFTPALGSMIIINPGEKKPIPVQFFPSDPNLVVNYIFMDINEDVWVFSSKSATDYIHVIKKGETTANIISNFGDICNDVYSNPVTKDIFLACVGGLLLAV